MRTFSVDETHVFLLEGLPFLNYDGFLRKMTSLSLPGPITVKVFELDFTLDPEEVCLRALQELSDIENGKHGPGTVIYFRFPFPSCWTFERFYLQDSFTPSSNWSLLHGKMDSKMASIETKMIAMYPGSIDGYKQRASVRDVFPEEDITEIIQRYDKYLEHTSVPFTYVVEDDFTTLGVKSIINKLVSKTFYTQ